MEMDESLNHPTGANNQSDSEPRHHSRSPIPQLTDYILRTRESDAIISFPQALLRASKAFLKRSPRPQVAPPEIAALIEALDCDTRNVCRQLDDIAFQTVYAFLWNAQPDLTYERGHFLFVDSLHPSHAKTLEEKRVLVTRKETLGASVLCQLINAFLDLSKTSRARRWIGSLALELLKDCQGNRQLLQQDAGQVKSAFGKAILQSSDEIQRLVAGRIIHEMVSRRDAGVLRKDFWPANINPATIRGFPINKASESQWSTDFVKYMDDLDSQNVFTQRRGYSAFVPGVQADDTTYESEESSSILVTLSDVLTIMIPTSATDSAKYIDIPLIDVQLQLGDPDSQPTQDSLNARDVLVLTFSKTEGEAYVINGRPCGPSPLYIFFGNEEDAGFWYDEIGAKIQRPDEVDTQAQEEDMDTLETLRPRYLTVHSAFLDISDHRSEPGRAQMDQTEESTDGQPMDLIRTASEANNLLTRTIEADGPPHDHAQTTEESNQPESDYGTRDIVSTAEETIDVRQHELHDAPFGPEVEEGTHADSVHITRKQQSAFEELKDNHDLRITESPSARYPRSSRDPVSELVHRRGGSEAEATPSDATSVPRSGKLSRTMRVEDGEQPFVLPLTPAMLSSARANRKRGDSTKAAPKVDGNNRKTASDSKLAAGTKRKSLAQQTTASNKKARHTASLSFSSRSSNDHLQNDKTTPEASVFDVPSSSPEASKPRSRPLRIGNAPKKDAKSGEPSRDVKRLKEQAMTSDEATTASSRRKVQSTKNTLRKEGPSQHQSTLNSQKLPEDDSGDTQSHEEGSNYIPSQQSGAKAKSKAAPEKDKKVSTAKQNTGVKRKAQRTQPRQDIATGLQRQTRASTRRTKNMAPRSKLTLNEEGDSSARKESEPPEMVSEAQPGEHLVPHDNQTTLLATASANPVETSERIEAEVSTDHPVSQRIDETQATLQPTRDVQQQTSVQSITALYNAGGIDSGERAAAGAAPAGASVDSNQTKIRPVETAPQVHSNVEATLNIDDDREDQQSSREATNFVDAMDVIAPDTAGNESFDDDLFEDGQAVLQAFDFTADHVIYKDGQLASAPTGSAAAIGGRGKEGGHKGLEEAQGSEPAPQSAQQGITVQANEGGNIESAASAVDKTEDHGKKSILQTDHHSHSPKASTAESLVASGAHCHLAKKLETALSDVLHPQDPFEGKGDIHTEELATHPWTNNTQVQNSKTPQLGAGKQVAVQGLVHPPLGDRHLQGSIKGPASIHKNPKSGSQSDPLVVSEGSSSDHEFEDAATDPGSRAATPFRHHQRSYNERSVKPALQNPEQILVTTTRASDTSPEARRVLPSKGLSVDAMTRNPRQRIQTPAKDVETNVSAAVSTNSGRNKDPNRLPRIVGFSGKGPRNQGVASVTAHAAAQARMEPKRVSEGNKEQPKRKREFGALSLDVADRTPAQTKPYRDSKRVRIEVLDDELQKPAPASLRAPVTRSPGSVKDKVLFEHSSWFADDAGPKKSSQSSRVDATGSPLPLRRTRHAFFPRNEQRRLDDYLSDSENVDPGMMDDEFTLVNQDSDQAPEPELPVIAVSGHPHKRELARIPSSNSKHGPSSPTAPSAMLTAFQAHEVHESGRLVNLETDAVLEPSKPQDPFTTKGQEQPDGFLNLLRRATKADAMRKHAYEKEQKSRIQGPSQASGQIGDGRSAPEDEDPDQTLVEDRRSRRRRRRYSTLSKTSDSANPDDEGSQSSENREAHEAAVRAWRDALDPRHQDILAILYEVSHELIGHLINAETAVTDAINDYERRGNRMLEKVKNDLNADYEQYMEGISKRHKDTADHLRQLQNKLTKRSRKKSTKPTLVEEVKKQRATIDVDMEEALRLCE